MHDNHSLATAVDQDSFLEQLRAALLQSFGEPFVVWLPGDPWTAVAGGPQELADIERYRSDLSHELTSHAWSGRASQHPPMVVNISADSRQVAIAVDGPNGLLVAVRSTAQSATALRKIASLFRRCWSLEEEVARYRKDLDICAAQIGDDFEELTFLRNLTEQLEASDATQTVWQVAQIVLPLLSPLIQAETLVLMPAQRMSRNSEEVSVGSPAVWVGPRPIDKDTCVALVEFLRPHVTQQALIKNRYEKTADGAQFPNVKEFILVPLDKGRFTVGWLLALNRTHRRIPRPDGAHWVLSDSEFGTVEASLLSSVASMLATHARNVELIQEKESLLVAVVRAMVYAIDA